MVPAETGEAMNKGLLTAMEGKNHDRRPPYSRKPRLHESRLEYDETRRWVCASCPQMVEGDDGLYCLSCDMYWNDVADGLYCE